MSENSYQQVVARLPEHLRRFCVDQCYDDYTAEHQLTWRFVVEQLTDFLTRAGHPAIIEGLRRFALNGSHIADIDEVNAGLAEVGWRAVIVDGFLPPVIFMEFQAHQVLPLSADMRTLEHIVYTPAPDIVHEAVGHTPMLAEPSYRAFLKRIGECGTKTLWNRTDDRVYQAIRALSIAKEHPNADRDEVRAAEGSLTEALKAQRDEPASEATRLARLHWWTVEYGLIGALESPKVFGAGLASSLLESQHCLGAATSRLRLSDACFDDEYDITAVQPHYYVARDWSQLNELLNRFEARCAFMRGGLDGVQSAIDHGTCATAEFASGLQVTGCFTRAIAWADGDLCYLGTSGPTELAFLGEALEGHSDSAHPEGFGAPVGELVGTEVRLSEATPAQLAQLGIGAGRYVELEFESGVTVTGRGVGIERRTGTNLLLELDDCRVTGPDGLLLYRPEWGRYHMVMGGSVDSVFGGPGDRRRLVAAADPRVTGLHSSMRDRPVRYSRTQRHAEVLYRRLAAGGDLDAIYTELCGLVGDKWLMLLGIYERATQEGSVALALKVHRELRSLRKDSSEKRLLIDRGLAALAPQDAMTA